MAQSIDLNLYIIKLTSSAEVCVLLPIGFIELLSQQLNFVLSSISAIVLNRSPILRSCSISFCQVDHLLVMGSFLCSLELKSASLLFEIALDTIL